MNKNRKLNIAMICDPIGENKSGVVVSTMRFAKLLKERGHKVIFIGAKSEEHKENSEHYGNKAYRFRSIPVPKSGGWNLAFPTVKELKRIFKEEKIDIVHIILPMSGAIMAIRAAKAMGIKMVAHSHSQPENLFTEMPKFIQPTLNNLWNRYLSWIYGKTEHLIYPSELARSLLEKLNKKEQKSTVISNGINIEYFKPIPTGDFHSRFKIPTESIKLLFVGRLFPEKSVDTIIKSMHYVLEENPNVHLMIVGGGHLRTKLEKEVHELGLAKNITFLGLVSEMDKILSYNASDIFILPSLAELEGMVVLEAMACGKPIIISDAEMSASKYFVNDNGFTFKTKDPRNLAEQITKLTNNPSLRQRHGLNSLKQSKTYDIHRSVELLEDVYKEAINQKND